MLLRFDLGQLTYLIRIRQKKKRKRVFMIVLLQRQQ